MFPYIGIMADQEPRRAFTPSGLYPMGSFDSGDSVDVTADITGTSNFTFMIWAFPTTANQYIFKTSDDTAFLQIKSDGKLRFQILNTNLTNSVVESASAISLNTLQMITVTGSTTNGLNLYINDVLNNSSSMPANNNVAGKTWQIGTNYDGSLALFRSWSKELALADIEAHYAYDENLLLQGGVAVSAMTTDQKTDLEFAVEMAQDVPYDGYEFDDRSTNKYTVTNNGATLIGVSLQVYTDANDLPNAGPQIYAVNSADLNGTSQRFDLNNSLQYGGSISFGGWLEASSQDSTILSREASAGDGGYTLYTSSAGTKLTMQLRNSSNSTTSFESTGTIPATGMNHLWCNYDGTDMKVYINGVLAGTNNAPSALGNNTTSMNTFIGEYAFAGILKALGTIGFVAFYNKSLSASDIADLSTSPVKCLDLLSSENPNLANPKLWVRLGDFNGNTADRLTNFGTDSITITNVNSTPFTGTGLNVECTPSATQVYTANYADFDTDQTAYTSPSLDMGALKSSGFSVSFWGSAAQYSNSRLFTIGNQAGDPSPSDFIIAMSGQTNSYFQYYNGSSFSTIPAGGLNFDILRHITVTYGGTADQNFRLYVDGSLRGTISGSDYQVGSLNQYVTIGGRTGAQGVFEASGGVKGHVFMFNKKLEQADIDNLSSDPTYVYNSLSEIGLDTSCILSVRCSNWNGNNGSEFTEDTGNATVSLNTGVAGSIAIDGTGPDVISGGGSTPPVQNSEFIFSVKTDNSGGVSANDQFKVGTTSIGVYNCTVDWGDGNSNTITTWDDPAWTHTYSAVGTYTITITGTSFKYPYFLNGDDTKVLDISQWGLASYGTTTNSSFWGCSNLTISASDLPDTSTTIGLTNGWRNCSSLTSFPLIDTSSVITITGTWYGCSSLTSFPLIDTSLVTSMPNAWNGCSNLTSFPLIDTSSVTLMGYAWLDCSSLADFPLIDVSACTSFTDTWKGCALNSASIDNIMQALVNGNQNNLTTDISGGTNLGFASWSAGAVANYNTLVSRGWIITTNP